MDKHKSTGSDDRSTGAIQRKLIDIPSLFVARRAVDVSYDGDDSVLVAIMCIHGSCGLVVICAERVQSRFLGRNCEFGMDGDLDVF